MNKITLPQDAVDALRQFLDDGDRSQWAFGDLAVEIVDEYYPNYRKGDIRRQIAIETGAAPETVRDRENMARFFTPGLREPYIVALTYHQLRACKAAGVKWREYAEWAMISADQWNGRSAPVVVIRARIQNNNHEDPPAWRRRAIKIIQLAQLIKADETAPVQIINLCNEIISGLNVHLGP